MKVNRKRVFSNRFTNAILENVKQEWTLTNRDRSGILSVVATQQNLLIYFAYGHTDLQFFFIFYKLTILLTIELLQ